MEQTSNFNTTLASQCARCFHAVCGIGCTISDRDGNVSCEFGYGYSACKVCELAGNCSPDRMEVHKFGMTEAERFGGKYIYTCQMGMTFFVSPIFQDDQADAKITVGPFLMVDKKDYIACELTVVPNLTLKAFSDIMEELENIPSIPTRNVTDMSDLLFMVIGYISNASATNKLLEKQESVHIQSDVSNYIHQLKRAEAKKPYPIDVETALLKAVKQMDQKEAKGLLNELLGYIMFSCRDLSTAKVRVYELLALMNRAVISSGSDVDQLLAVNEQYFLEISKITDYDSLCFWLSRIMGTMINSIFEYGNIRHSNVIHRSVQYIREHYADKITLEDMARQVHLSPTYFSRIFNQELGEPFTGYLNRVRIERSLDLLKHTQLKMTDIALTVGFSDQSYFSRTFKKIMGISPVQYRGSI